jgi:ubiquinone/menaquinone biosynthesis C-methylase UbiE
MPAQIEVSRHYSRQSLTEDIRAGLAALGRTPTAVTIDDLAPVDEFHTGGRRATEDLLDQLELAAAMHVLDVGCGLGGPARLAAARHACRVTGIDLSGDYVAAGNMLSRWVGLERTVTLLQGSALSLPFADRSFDGAWMLHVGMNIDDKERLAGELARVLRPGACLGIYDMMRVGVGELAYPVPWAATAELSALAEPARYRSALEAAGFALTAERDRRDFALDFFAQMRARAAGAAGPPPLGIHLLMGSSTSEKLKNMVGNIAEGRIAPVELISRRR